MKENNFKLWLKQEKYKYQEKNKKIEKFCKSLGYFIGLWLEPTTIPITLYFLQKIF